jgi:hypothetical protein
MNKFNARKTTVDGIMFASAGEAARYKELLIFMRSGIISGLTLQPTFDLAPSVVINGRKRPRLRYIADFAYTENGQRIIEDFKGFITDVYRIKRHLMMSIHGIEIRETGKSK